MYTKGLRDERTPFRSELDQAHAPVVGILPFHKRSLPKSVDRDTDRSRREPYFGTDRVDRQRSLMEQHFEHPEIRVAESGLAQVQTLLRMSRQGVKGLHERSFVGSPSPKSRE